MTFKYMDMSSAYNDILGNLMYDPEYDIEPRGQKIKEITNTIIEIGNPLNNLFLNATRNSPLKYIAAELFWYFSGSNTTEYISKYATMWDSLKNTDGTVNSAYGYLLFKERNAHGLTQYQWVIESLKRDKDSRQAFMHFNNPSHQFFENKDQVCTLNGVFQIRKDMLNLTITMRSNDVILGFPADFAFFSVLQQQLHRHLLKYYPNLKIGSYTHISNSMHVYEKHFKLAEEMLESPFYAGLMPELDCNLIEEDGTPIDLTKINDSVFLNFLRYQIKK